MQDTAYILFQSAFQMSLIYTVMTYLVCLGHGRKLTNVKTLFLFALGLAMFLSLTPSIAALLLIFSWTPLLKPGRS